jgi:hypothetical protein
MKHLFLFSSLIIMGINPSKEKSNCSESFRVSYSKNKVTVRTSTTHIQLLEGFNDSIEIYLNNSLVEKGFYQTNRSLGSAGGFIVIKRRKIRSNVLLIKNISKDRCLEFMIDSRYKIIYVDFDEEIWGIRYSDTFDIHE